MSLAILHHGGLGHTIGLWANDEEVLNAWFLEKPASRIIVNGPTSQGATGYSTGLAPAMSLGCGPHAGNITSDNITARHMVNVKRVAFTCREWEITYERDNARAAQLTGERAPRGSALGGGPGADRSAGRRQGGQSTRHRRHGAEQLARESAARTSGARGSIRRTPATASPAVARPPASSPVAPRFTNPEASASSTATATTVRASAPSPVRVEARSEGRAAGPAVGASLTAQDIRSILSHAGAGCPPRPLPYLHPPRSLDADVQRLRARRAAEHSERSRELRWKKSTRA